ncbi:hypothetical protein JCM11251_006404 [Rhodosporidiobolus azoricus]
MAFHSTNPFSALSDNADARGWAQNEPTTAPSRPLSQQPTSIASSHQLVNSIRRHAVAKVKLEKEEAEMRREFEEKLRLRRAKVNADLKMEDMASDAGVAGPAPDGTATQAQGDVARRRLEDLKHEIATLERVVQGPLASVSVKIKPKEPKAWTGEFDYAKREGWIRTAKLYLAGLEMDMNAAFGKEITPFPFFLVCSLFSADVLTNSSISPQSWFDSRNSRSPFSLVKSSFKALRAHWADDNAAEVALQRYCGARQGNLRAHDFGSQLDALADSVFDRTIDDLDRRTTFLDGLKPAVRDFVKTQLAAREALGGAKVDFEAMVKMASLTDSLAMFSASKITSVSSSATSSVKKAAADASAPTTKPGAAAAAPRLGSTWSADAVLWQQQNPEAKRLEWFDARAKSLSKPIRCYNCGLVGDHFSRACTSARKDPRQVVIAMLALLSASSPTAPSSQSPSLPATSASIQELKGKEDEE